jgi:hypothetical protein
MSGKNKLVPRLLGVTKDSIVRVDERTKDVRSVFISLSYPISFQFLEVWSLTHVKRWTASPNTFTLVKKNLLKKCNLVGFLYRILVIMQVLISLFKHTKVNKSHN